jgi:hypothetical protein
MRVYRSSDVPISSAARAAATSRTPTGIGISARSPARRTIDLDWMTGDPLALRLASADSRVGSLVSEEKSLAAPGGLADRLHFASFARQDPVEFVARADVELGEHLVQVVFDRAWADEQLRATLGVRVALAGKLGDLCLLRVGCKNSVRAPRSQRFAGRTLILAPHRPYGAVRQRRLRHTLASGLRSQPRSRSWSRPTRRKKCSPGCACSLQLPRSKRSRASRRGFAVVRTRSAGLTSEVRSRVCSRPERSGGATDAAGLTGVESQRVGRRRLRMAVERRITAAAEERHRFDSTPSRLSGSGG